MKLNSKARKISGLFMIMLVVGMMLVTPAMACPPNEPIDPEVEGEIVKAISKEVKLPEEYYIFQNSETDGYFLIYNPSETTFKLIDISPSYEILEIWDGTTSVIPGGYEVKVFSDKGNEVSATLLGDPTSDSAKLTVYDSSKDEVITRSVGCYEICMGACGALVGTQCPYACGKTCAILIESGFGIVACFSLCLLACGGATVVGCDGICEILC